MARVWHGWGRWRTLPHESRVVRHQLPRLRPPHARPHAGIHSFKASTPASGPETVAGSYRRFLPCQLSVPTQTVTPDQRWHVVSPCAPEELTGVQVVRLFVPQLARERLTRQTQTKTNADRQTDRRRRRETTSLSHSGGCPIIYNATVRMHSCLFRG